jgi:hypothetical protein
MNIKDCERVNAPYPPNRFRTYEDAAAFIQNPARVELAIPQFIEERVEGGFKTRINPEYRDAPFEEAIVKIKGGYIAPMITNAGRS